MRDEETGSWWQQITGKAIFGPLKGQQLEPVLSDELTFGLWKQESPTGQVLAPVAKYVKEYGEVGFSSLLFKYILLDMVNYVYLWLTANYDRHS